MKKIVFSILLLAGFMQSLSAQSIERLFDTFKDANNVTYVNLPKSLIRFALKSTGDKEVANVLSKLDNVVILNLEDADTKVRQRFQKTVKNMRFDGYESLVTSNEGNEKTRILVKADDQKIVSVVIINTDDEECSFIRVNGTLKYEELQTLTETVDKDMLGAD